MQGKGGVDDSQRQRFSLEDMEDLAMNGEACLHNAVGDPVPLSYKLNRGKCVYLSLFWDALLTCPRLCTRRITPGDAADVGY